LSSEVAETAIVYPGTVLGDGCKILDYAVVGKQPTLGPRSTAMQEELAPLELRLVAGEGAPHKAARDAIPVVRALDQLQASLETVVA